MTTGRIDPRFGHPEATAPTWAEVEGRLGAAELYWLTTLRPDGRPHVAPLVGAWIGGAFVFCTGRGEQKWVNLQSHAEVAVTTGTNTWKAGTDVVVEGRAERVTGAATLSPMAAAYRDKYGDDWPWQADDDGFVDGDEHPVVYRVAPRKVLVFGKDPHSQTTFVP